MLYAILALLYVGLMAMRVRADFRRDAGRHRGAKVLHCLAMAALLPQVSGLPQVVGGVQRAFTRPGWPLSEGVGFGLLWLGAAAAAVGAMYLLGKLSERAPRARTAAAWAFPALGVQSGLAFDHGLLRGRAPASTGEWIIAVVVVLVAGGLYALPSAFYASAWARDLFALGRMTREELAAAFGVKQR